MALFQPFKGATQRKGSAVGDAITQAQFDAAEREMMAKNIQGAAQVAQWGLSKETSPWADSIYGPATPEGAGEGPQIDPNVLAERNAQAAALRAPEVAPATSAGGGAMNAAMGAQQDPSAGLAQNAAGVGAGFAMGGPAGAGMAAIPLALQLYSMYS